MSCILHDLVFRVMETLDHTDSIVLVGDVYERKEVCVIKS
jgi:hypothetical protein